MSKDGILELEFSAPKYARFTTGEWNITRGEVPKGGVYIGTLAGGYTIWSDQVRGGMAGDEAANAALIRAAPVLFSTLATIIEGMETMRVGDMLAPKAAAEAGWPEAKAAAIVTKLRVRTAVRFAMRPLTAEEEAT